MADWRALYESWDSISEENKQLIEKLFREKPKEKLIEFFEREPYAERVYEKAVGKWKPLPPPEAQPPQVDRLQKEAAQLHEKGVPKSTFFALAWNKGVVVLPVLTLITVLSAEITYYSSQSVTFLDNALPFNLKTWLILLILALALGLANSVYILKHQFQRQKIDALQGATRRA